KNLSRCLKIKLPHEVAVSEHWPTRNDDVDLARPVFRKQTKTVLCRAVTARLKWSCVTFSSRAAVGTETDVGMSTREAEAEEGEVIMTATAAPVVSSSPEEEEEEEVMGTEFGFSSSNRFSALDASNAFDKGGRGAVAGLGTAGDEDDDKKLEVIQADVDAWESSGQWGFSCYSSFKTPISGFTDLSPEELRLEYYSTRASGDLQGYLNGVNQLLSQWKSRVQELKIMSPSTRLALLAELKGTAPQSSSSGFGSTATTGFGSSTSGFGSKGFGAPAQSVTFGFPALSSGFGSSSTSSLSTGFGSLITAPTQPPSGSGSSSVPSASSFSFAAPSADKPPPTASSGFGSASGFSFSTTTATTGGGLGSAFGGTAASLGAGAVGETTDGLFSPESKLTQEELNQFKAKRFTLGQIPLKPPPANMLVV
ncbi:hypothetical protein CCH79_00008415, partial [Gambusia affinis]